MSQYHQRMVNAKTESDMAKAEPREKALPPDPDGQNDDRASWADGAIIEFQARTGTDRCDALADLLCDLLHWADRESDMDFDTEIARARHHYEVETTPGHPDA